MSHPPWAAALLGQQEAAAIQQVWEVQSFHGENSVQREAWASTSAEAEGFCKRTSDQPRLSRHVLDPWELDDTSGKS